MVYLDASATNPLLPEVRDAMLEVMDLSVKGELGNPSSLHSTGSRGRDLLAAARESVAELIGASSEEILFTSGGSESNNTVLHAFAGCPLFVSAIEHPSVLEPAKLYGSPCWEIPVDRQGIINLSALETQLRRTLKHSPQERLLVSVMAANNETGSLQPLAALSALLQTLRADFPKAQLFFHTDATQAVGKIEIDAKKLGVDYLTFSSHKLGGPVGIGALYIKHDSPFRPLILGGAQENKKRAGTSNAILATGFATAARIAKTTPAKYQEIAELRDYLASEIKKRTKTATLVCGEECTSPRPSAGQRAEEEEALARNDGPRELRVSESTSDRKQLVLPNILNVSFPGAEGESTQLYLDLAGIEVSTGSACASGDIRPSHVLMAMFGDAEVAHNSVRFSLNLKTKKQDIDYLLKTLPPIIERLQKLSTINLKESV